MHRSSGGPAGRAIGSDCERGWWWESCEGKIPPNSAKLAVLIATPNWNFPLNCGVHPKDSQIKFTGSERKKLHLGQCAIYERESVAGGAAAPGGIQSGALRSTCPKPCPGNTRAFATWNLQKRHSLRTSRTRGPHRSTESKRFWIRQLGGVSPRARVSLVRIRLARGRYGTRNG